MFERSENAPDEERAESAVSISASAYIRSMLAIAWESFRRPFQTSEIDLVTGKVVKPKVEER